MKQFSCGFLHFQTGGRELGEAWTLCQDSVGKIVENAGVVGPSLLHGDLFDINIGQCNGEAGEWGNATVVFHEIVFCDGPVWPCIW